MTPDDFRRIALELPESEEREHMKHPDFRVSGRIFATMSYPTEEHGMIKLSPELQQSYVKGYPKMFVPVPGAWGTKGCTHVMLSAANVPPVRSAMAEAWKIASEPKPTLRKAAKSPRKK